MFTDTSVSFRRPEQDVWLYARHQAWRSLQEGRKLPQEVQVYPVRCPLLSGTVASSLTASRTQNSSRPRSFNGVWRRYLRSWSSAARDCHSRSERVCARCSNFRRFLTLVCLLGEARSILPMDRSLRTSWSLATSVS
jgi:hypothetical protein